MSAAPYRQWQCFFCAEIYDEAEGRPEEGIPAGTRWEDVPESWTCPGCGASKADFYLIEAQ
ncbi:MAG TPA: rubredoxin [Pseudomonadales bacterium]|nr:rubredoxin [Pseudomonadales bacterium]